MKTIPEQIVEALAGVELRIAGLEDDVLQGKARIAELEDALRELQGAAEIVCEQLDSVGSVALGDYERLRAMATIAHGVLGEAK